MNGPLSTDAFELTLDSRGRNHRIVQVVAGAMPTSKTLESYSTRRLAEEALDRAGFRKTSLAGHWIRRRIIGG